MSLCSHLGGHGDHYVFQLVLCDSNLETTETTSGLSASCCVGDGLPNAVLGDLPSLVFSSLKLGGKDGYKVFSAGDLFLYILIKMCSGECPYAFLIKGMTVTGWFRVDRSLSLLVRKTCAMVVAEEAKMTQSWFGIKSGNIKPSPAIQYGILQGAGFPFLKA